MANKDKTMKTVIGLGAVGIAAYLAYAQLTADDSQTIGGSGSFSGLGGGESLTEEGVSGTSDSGIAYNINLPEIDTSGIEALMSGGNISPSASQDKSVSSIITGAGEVSTVLPKKTATSSGLSTTASETSGSLSSSLGQVFGTQAQKTNERGDYYTTAAGGGAGAIKGLSIGEQVINLLGGKTASGKSSSSYLPSGASTASKSLGLTTENIKQIAQTKKEQEAAIAKTKIAAPTANKAITDVSAYLKSGGTFTNTSTGAVIGGKSSGSSQPTTKKQAVSSSSIKRQGGSGTGEGKVRIIRKS